MLKFLPGKNKKCYKTGVTFIHQPHKLIKIITCSAIWHKNSLFNKHAEKQICYATLFMFFIDELTKFVDKAKIKKNVQPMLN